MFLIDKNSWEVKKTKEKGLGVFAMKEIKKGTVIADYLGKQIKLSQFDPELEKNGLYLMYFTDECAIFPDLNKPGPHLLNHSCKPNCQFYIYKWHTLFFALKTIMPGEELTIAYTLGPKEECINCTHNCKCDSKNCTGTMHLTRYQYKKWRKYQDTLLRGEKKPKVVFGQNLPKLKSYPKTITPTGYLDLYLYSLSHPVG